METPRTAPAFRAPSSRGQTLELGSFAGKVPVLLFVTGPLDDPATGELLAALDRLEVEFGRRRVQLLGLAPATSHQLREAAEARDLEVTLLADPDGAIAESYGLARDGERPAAALVDRDLALTPLPGAPAAPAAEARWLLEAVDRRSPFS